MTGYIHTTQHNTTTMAGWQSSHLVIKHPIKPGWEACLLCWKEDKSHLNRFKEELKEAIERDDVVASDIIKKRIRILEHASKWVHAYTFYNSILWSFMLTAFFSFSLLLFSSLLLLYAYNSDYLPSHGWHGLTDLLTTNLLTYNLPNL